MTDTEIWGIVLMVAGATGLLVCLALWSVMKR